LLRTLAYSHPFFVLLLRRPPPPSLFPYTTLFRSHALQARQPDIASLTSCEKSYSPLFACQLLRVRAINVRKLTPDSGSSCSSLSGSTPRSANKRSHSRTSVARPFGE